MIWEISTYGGPDPRIISQNPKGKKSSSKEGEDTDDTGSSLAESVRMETAQIQIV